MKMALLRKPLLFLLVLLSVIVLGRTSVAAENPCDGPLREEAVKHGLVCPEKNKPQTAKEIAPPAREIDKTEKEETKQQPDFFKQLALKETALDSAKLKPFGQGVFSGAEAAAQESLPVSPDYPVGPGDEIGVVFWGRVTGEHVLQVNLEGAITIPMIGTLVVNGLNYGEVRELVARKVKSVIGAEVSVTLGRLRGIQVFVLGEVLRPGAHKLNAAATVSNALMAAGGATSIGSLRKVELRREGEKTRQIDFYDLLLKGDRTGDLRLKSGDVVFVQVIGPVSGVVGNVRRPALYEIKEATSLMDALFLAGGIEAEAYTQQVQVERIEDNKKRVVVDINAAEETKAKAFLLKDGDVVKVYPVTGNDTNAVYLHGNVKRPGKYELKPGLTLKGLVRGYSDLLEETDLEYGAIKRLTPGLDTMVIPFNPGALLAGEKKEDIELKPLDSVYFFSKWLFRERPSITIEGEVRKPGRYNLEENLTVKDLVLKAGGLTDEASWGEYELYRKNRKTQEVTFKRLDLGEALNGQPSHNATLEDADVVKIHSALEKDPLRTVEVYGMVNNPGKYAYATGMRISDLVFAGGGLKESAYLKEAELASYDVEEGKVSKVSYRIVDLEKALGGDMMENAFIKPHDSLFVREMTDWHNQQYVELKGEVNFPGKYVFKKGEKLSSVIRRAGGFTDEAYLKGAVFTRESVKEAQQKNIEEAIRRLEIRLLTEAGSMTISSIDSDGPKQAQAVLAMKKELLSRMRSAQAQGRISIKLENAEKFNDTRYDVALENGDVLFVPVRPTQVQVMGAVQNPAAFIHEEGHELSSYIGKAGGYSGDADEGKIFVLKSDGTAVSKGGSWLSGSMMSAKLDPGDTVVVPEKLDRGLWLKEIKDLTQILYQIAVTAGVLIVAF